MGKSALAKISRPRLFSVAPRERLFALLDDNRGRPLVWISGPPGAGKTALVASYLEERESPAIWYQIDAGDADPATVFHYLALASEASSTTALPSLPRFVPEHLSDLPSFTRLFFRAFFSQFPERAMLVLDNYQEAPEDALLHEILRHAIAEVPPDNSVIAISRVEAPSVFVQLAASAAMINIGWDKLQLSLDEVRTIAAKRCVTDDWLLKALHQQSQGWAAGITLMLERLGHFDGKSEELPTETRESVFNYFASLIFDQASQETRHILLSIAFLPRVTPTLAYELSSRAEAPTLLEDLYRRRMFTDRRPGTEPVYQFHALFLEFLRARAREVLIPEEFANLLQRSAFALESTGAIDVSVELWLETRDRRQAIRLILKEANGLLSSGRRQTLVRWIEQIPAPNYESEPWLVYWFGRAQMQTDPGEGIKTLELALELFRQSDDRPGLTECLIDLIGGAHVGFGALNAIDRWLDELLDQIDLSAESPSANLSLRAYGVLCMALFHAKPWHKATMPAYRQIEILLPDCTDPNVALKAATEALVVSGLCGDLECGGRIARATEALAERETTSPSDASWWFAQVGYLHYVKAQYEEALRYYAKAYRIAESNGLRTVLGVIVLWRILVEFRVVGWPAANASFAEFEAMSQASEPMSSAMLYLFLARREAHHGSCGRAADLAAISDSAAMRTGSRLEEMLYGLCNADILLDAGRTKEARPLLLRSQKWIGRAPVYNCWRAAQLLMESRLARVEGDTERTCVLLRQALALAREGNQRYYLRFLDRALAPLFRLALEEGIEVDLVQDIIRMFRLKPPKDAPDNWPWPVRIFTLGRFEARVNDEPIEFSRKLPRKTLLLLKAIVALGGREVPEQLLCDALWGDEEGDAARNALGIAVLRLRKLLGSNESVSHQGGKISLNPEICWVDTWVFEERLSGVQSGTQKLLSLYAGCFLPEDEGESWSVAPRERLRGKFIDALSRLGSTLESAGDLSGAVQCYLRGIDADAIVESFYQGLMRCYEGLGRRTEALSVFRRLKHTLSVVLGVPPSEATQRLFREMLDRQAEEGGPSGSNDESSVGDGGKHSRREGDLGVVVKLETQRRRKR
jgi:LuxR family transcriptional regulator, maltose regulon positive regulatory protein